MRDMSSIIPPELLWLASDFIMLWLPSWPAAG